MYENCYQKQKDYGLTYSNGLTYSPLILIPKCKWGPVVAPFVCFP